MHYALDGNGDYHLLDDDEEIALSKDPVKEIAIAYSAPKDASLMWTLHKHGTPELVSQWLATAKSKFTKIGGLGQEMADELRLLQGRIDVDEVNRAIDSSGYVKKLVERHISEANTIDVQARELPLAPVHQGLGTCDVIDRPRNFSGNW